MRGTFGAGFVGGLTAGVRFTAGAGLAAGAFFAADAADAEAAAAGLLDDADDAEDDATGDAGTGAASDRVVEAAAGAAAGAAAAGVAAGTDTAGVVGVTGRGGSFFATYNWAARVPTRRNRTSRNSTPSTTLAHTIHMKAPTIFTKMPNRPWPKPHPKPMIYSSSSSMSRSFSTVPTATATVSPQMTHMSARRQSRGPLRVACTVLQPPKTALSIVPLKRNLRTGQRYRVLHGSTDSQMHYTGGA